MDRLVGERHEVAVVVAYRLQGALCELASRQPLNGDLIWEREDD